MAAPRGRPERPAAAAPAAAAAPDGDEAVPAVHLVVLQHGLWGTPCNMCSVLEHLETTLQGVAGQERVVLENSGAAALGGG